MTVHLIRTQDDIDAGIRWLGAREEVFARMRETVGTIPLRLRPGGFQSLLSAIVSQQISVGAADAVWNRLQAAGLTDARNIATAPDEAFRACGLSRQKIRYARALAGSNIDFATLGAADSDEVIATLTTISGIGRWSAEIYTMFSLGHADVLAAGDLALQEAARMAFGLDKRPREAELRRLSANWSPWRAVAARMLWAYYRETKKREGIR